MVLMVDEAYLVEQALVYYASGEVKASLDTLDQVIKLADEQNNLLSKARTMGKKGVIYLETDQLESAQHCLEEVLALSDQLENPELKSDALSNLGLTLTASGDPGHGLLRQQEALQIARKTENSRLIMTHLGLLGHAYIQLANFEEAGKAYIEALKIAREINDIDTQRGFLNNLGVIFAYLEQHENAVKAFNELSELAFESSDYVLALNAEKNLVKHAIAMGKIEEVIIHSRKGLNLIDAYLCDGSEREVFEETLLLGLMSNSNYSEAKQELAQVIRSAEEAGDKVKILKYVGQMADANYALEDLEAAEREYLRALELSIRLQQKPIEARLLGRLAALAADLDDLEKSNQYLVDGRRISVNLGI